MTDSGSKMKRKIYVTHSENMRFFKGNLATWRNGFTYIVRTVSVMEDPDNIFDDYAEFRSPSGHVLRIDGDDIIGPKRS